MGGEAAVQVAVRVRPFNGREKRMNAKRCIDMEGSQTHVYEDDVEDTDMDPRTFNFDYSLWSHFDMATEEGGHDPENPDRPKCDQNYCYDQIGKKLLNNFWDGYDVCMFAYGQSGAGKSFSMTGTGPKCSEKWKGIIPRIARDTFIKADEIGAEPNTSFKITASMLEIYVNEIYDLLIPPEEYNIKTRAILEMQMDDVKGLSQLPVAAENDVTDLLVRGFGNQTKAPTGLNVDSSRGHTIFTLDVVKIVENPKARKKSEKRQHVHTRMKLVDLAGSERTEKVLEITKAQLAALLTQKYGKAMSVDDKMMAKYKEERTKEGRAINNSLTTLGNCVKQVSVISGIADKKKRKKKMDQIAWRSSQLTRLLRTALNGKCKTIMIAAVSPSLSEYPETVSTMRYANQIKMIKSTAVKKEAKLSQRDIQAAKIKELEAALMAALEGAPAPGGDGGGGGGGGGGAAVDDPEKLRALKEMLDGMQKGLQEADKKEKEMEERMAKLRAENAAREEVKKTHPFLLLILDNPMTTGLYPTAIPDGDKIVGGDKENDKYQLKLKGSGVKDPHVEFKNSGGKVTIHPSSDKASCLVNGTKATKGQELAHNDRIRLAEDNFFRFLTPDGLAGMSDGDKATEDEKWTYEKIKEESMASILQEFKMGNTENEDQARVRALEEKLKKREQEFSESIAREEEIRAQEKQQAELEIKQVKDKLAAEKDKKLKAQLKAELEQKEKQYKQMLDDAKIKGKQRQEEEKKYRQKMIKDDEAEAARRDTEKARIQYDLMDAIPCCRQVNQFAKELKIKSKFEVKLISDQTPNGLMNIVCVELIDEEKGNATELWPIEEFRSRFGEMSQTYLDLKAQREENGSAQLPPGTPFQVNPRHAQVIGHAKVVMNFIYFNLEIDDTVPLVSYDGKVAGSITVKVEPLWDTLGASVQAAVEEAENLRELPPKDLTHLDLKVSVVSCQTLPEKFASRVRVKFGFPDHIISSLRVPDGKGGFKDMADKDGDGIIADDEIGTQHGGFYWTPPHPDPEPSTKTKLEINPKINHECIVRIHELKRKALNWFEHGDLIITVLGENTSLAKYIPKTQAAASPKANIATSSAVAVKVDPKAQKEFDSATKQNDKLRGELKKKKGGPEVSGKGLNDILNAIALLTMDDKADLQKRWSSFTEQGSQACSIM